ncbi:NAD-dependent epimerase/dehydratase family protein [Leifsonia sp. NPDC056665]|uniref:NAD-dependent epimerase/dehydratase family protein n=1 Tax=Leifsonia sp. NPDC056665 TaxID=3345901 RepID=UPI0036AD420F
MKRVLLTGASGRLGTVLSAGLPSADRQLVRTDRLAKAPLEGLGEVLDCDLTDLNRTTDLLTGADVVVHCAGIPDEATFDVLRDSNVTATYNVFEAARVAGVKRVIYASSAHVVGLYLPGKQLDPNSPPAPDSVYAATKLFGESVGSVYATKHSITVVNVRIGSFRPRPENSRQLSTWLSPRDAVQLFNRAIRAETTGVVTVYGVSANSRSWWPTDGADRIGYSPEDSADDYDGLVPVDPDSLMWQGGIFARTDYAGGAG